MKLEFHGHDERYIVEQSLMNLFPLEKPVYGPVQPGEDDWCRLAAAETAAECRVTAELRYRGHAAAGTFTAPLSGTDFEKEGQRRHAVAACFYLAFQNLYPQLPEEVRAAEKLTLPPWGMLTGVRPDKPVTWALMDGQTPEEAKNYLKEHYFVPENRAALALETGTVGYQARKRLEKRDIDLYVGIPFCPTRCAYCSFVSQSVERSFSLVEPYVKALIAEIRAGGEMVQKNHLRPRTFYMGGGTPGILTPDQMDAILTALEESFDLSACPEITVEAGRPDTITAEKLAVLKCHGVTRVSVNPQTMEDKVLSAIGRRHTAAETEQAMELVRAYHFRDVNMDLIAGLPEDTPDGFRRSLDKCLEMGASNITVHTLALKKGSRILTEGLSIPDGAAVQAMLDYAAPTLRSAGFAPYYLYRQKYMSGSFENVGWCRPGGECWYNVDIMSELCSILSFGAGGSTKMVEPGTNHIERVFNVKYPKEYTERPEKILANQAAFAEFYAKYVPET